MTTFSVWKFDEPAGADEALRILDRASHDGIVKVLDHAVVRWPEGEDKPETKVGHDDKKRGGAWGGLLGVVIGMLFFVPVIGGLVGAAIGAAAKAAQGTGITKEQLAKIRETIVPGTSALFVVTEEGDLDRLGERFHGMKWTLISSNLTEEERQMVVETFGGEDRT
jgi:uncharacterized membrane protein